MATAVNYKKYQYLLLNIWPTNTEKVLENIYPDTPAKEPGCVVLVAGKKPLIEQKINRVVLNVDASVTNMGATALEILEKTPRCFSR